MVYLINQNKFVKQPSIIIKDSYIQVVNNLLYLVEYGVNPKVIGGYDCLRTSIALQKFKSKDNFFIQYLPLFEA